MNKQQLFIQAFGDSDSFVDYYFNKRNNKPKTFLKYFDNQLVAQINVFDLKLTCNNLTFKTALISGVAVEKSQQNKGVMQEFLTRTLCQISSDYDIAILSPVNDNYYKKYGFSSLFNANFKNIVYKSNNDYSARQATIDDIDILLELYYNKAKTCDLYQQISKQTLADLFFDCKTSGNQVFIVQHKNVPIGWVFIDSEVIFVNTLLNENILQHIKEFDNKKLCVFDKNGEKELFQIKIFNQKIQNLNVCNCMIIDRY